MKTIKRSFIFIFLFHLSLITQAQYDTAGKSIAKWEASVSSGLYVDLFYANISIIGDTYHTDPLSYPDKPGKRVQSGKVDRLELKYNFNRKASASINFGYATWRDLYGTGNDPLEFWKETKRTFHRIQFAGNYYRNFHTKNKKGVINVGIGFLIQGEQTSFPFYRVSPTDPPHILEMNATGLGYWWDWATQLTASYYHSINPNLKIGATFYTYIIGTDVDGAGIMGSIAIPFGKKKIR